MYISLYQIFLKSTFYEIASQAKCPGMVWTAETIFVKQEFEKNVGNFVIVAVKFSS